MKIARGAVLDRMQRRVVKPSGPQGRAAVARVGVVCCGLQTVEGDLPVARLRLPGCASPRVDCELRATAGSGGSRGWVAAAFGSGELKTLYVTKSLAVN
jgi:hypothetical protein